MNLAIKRFQYDMTRWIKVRNATPVGPLANQGLASSFHAVPAISRCIHGEPPVNSLMNIAPVMAPPPLPLPMFWMSATVPFINSRYSSPKGTVADIHNIGSGKGGGAITGAM